MVANNLVVSKFKIFEGEATHHNNEEDSSDEDSSDDDL